MDISGICRVKMHYKLALDSGEVVQDSAEGEPIEFEYGRQEIIPGLEKHLEGLSEGEEKTVVVPAEEGYGLPNPQAVVNVPKEEFPAGADMEEGTMLQLQMADGRVVPARFVEMKGDDVILDLNHPLAGENLHFTVKIQSVGESQGPTIEEAGCGCGCGDEAGGGCGDGGCGDGCC